MKIARKCDEPNKKIPKITIFMGAINHPQTSISHITWDPPTVHLDVSVLVHLYNTALMPCTDVPQVLQSHYSLDQGGNQL